MDLDPDFDFSWGLSHISRSTVSTYALLSDPTTSKKANEIFARMRQQLFEVLTVPVPGLQDKSVAQVLNVHVTAPNAPSPELREELTLLKSSLNSSLEILSQGVNTLVARANESVGAPKGKAGSKPSAQKTLQSKSSPPSAQTPAQPKPPTASKPSFASVTQGASRPSLVVSELTSRADMTLMGRRSPQEICKHLNAALFSSTHQVILSAVRWTPKNNLVVIAGPDTTADHLNAASPFISDTLATFLSRDSPPRPITSCEGTSWSCILIRGIPTGVSPTRGAYSPSECHHALMVDNPFYCTIHLTQPPSWVKSPALYSSGSLSSLVVVFEDPDGKTLKGLLAQRHLFAFGHVGKLRQWKRKPHMASTPSPPASKGPRVSPPQKKSN
jgi:hypothetical protein